MSSTNPYQTPSTSDDEATSARWQNVAADDQLEPVSRSFIATILSWTLVCFIAAAPSFYLGMGASGGRYGAMIAGIMTYVVIYIAVDYRTRDHWWRRNRWIRRTLRVTYICRIILTIVFPAAVTIDMICGIFSMPIGKFLTRFSEFSDRDDFGGGMSFITAYVVTFIQGFACHVVLLIFGVFVYLIVRGIDVIRRG